MRKKKSKCPKKNFQSVERGKKCKCRISGVRKKKGRISGKKIKVFWVEILLSSCHWFGFILICKLKLREEKMKIFKVFKVKVTVAKKI